MTESVYWRFPLTPGHWHRSICWLVRPSSVDERMPLNVTIMWELTEPAMGYPYVPRILARSIGRQEIEDLSIEMYRRGVKHGFRTLWYDVDGNRVEKRLVLRAMKIETMVKGLVDDMGELGLYVDKRKVRELSDELRKSKGWT